MKVQAKKISVIFVASEATPLAKVGGLGDVIGSLPKALYKNGVKVEIILPFYGSIRKDVAVIKKTPKILKVALLDRKERVGVWETKLPGSDISVFLLDHVLFTGNDIYSSGVKRSRFLYLSDMIDIEKFVFFSHAAYEFIISRKKLPDIVHCHDWHSAPVIDFLKNSKDHGIKTVFTIHNLANQGTADEKIIKANHIESSGSSIAGEPSGGQANFMLRAILNADKITTVSPCYAREILTRQYGCGLERALRSRKDDLSGIINGIDEDFFDPAKDNLIIKKYSKDTLELKVKNKLDLQKKLKLPENARIAMLGAVSRFVWQKGFELLDEKLIEELCIRQDRQCMTAKKKNYPLQIVMLGSGDASTEKKLKKLEKKFPFIKIILGFDEALGHMIYAASDLFLMPSRFEPCGLGQLIAMQYGSLPIVRKTGGLADTVTEETGFVFEKFKTHDLGSALEKALDTYYRKPKTLEKMRKNAMSQDYSWNKSAKEYIRLYEKLVCNNNYENSRNRN